MNNGRPSAIIILTIYYNLLHSVFIDIFFLSNKLIFFVIQSISIIVHGFVSENTDSEFILNGTINAN